MADVQLFVSIVFFVVSAVSGASIYGRPKIVVSLYFESLCPGCSQFIKTQLRPAIHMLHDRVTVHYVPFGHASSLPDGTFKNQHGPAEGLGNMIMLCALNAVPLNDVQKVDYLACEETSHAATRGDLSCVARAGIPPERVQQMMQSGEGSALMLQAEQETKVYNPKGIPFITINGVPRDDARENLLGILQSLINQGY